MYKIYLNEDLLLICTPLELAENAVYNGIATCRPGIEGTKLLQKLQTTKKLAVITDSPQEEFALFAGQFVNIEAAGGIVVNGGDEVLMIFRNGRWDLPKGKMECSEDISECALREINEECGIDGLVNDHKLTETYHIYPLAGNWILKRTHWYLVRHEGCRPLKPQTEEGITEVKWVAKDLLPEYLRNTYPTIIDVFRAAHNSYGK